MSFVFNCFCTAKESTNADKQSENETFARSLFNLSEKHNISILPVENTFELENLYPKRNHVEEWTTFVVGKDKTYIVSNPGSMSFANSDNLVNHKGTGFLPSSLEEFLDPIWDRTLGGNDLQFFILYDGKTYFVNTFGFKNRSGNIVGACMFLRLFETIPNQFKMYKRLSLDASSKKSEKDLHVNG
jgi:hypothetical protein